MEEKSLPLIEKNQYTSEVLDRTRSNLNKTINEEKTEVEQLRIKINELERSIKHKIDRENSYQDILMYSFSL